MILDTNGLSAVAEGEAAMRPVPRKAAQVAIPVIVLGEYCYGISHSRNRHDYEQWLVQYLPKFRILDVDERTTTSYSAIRTELRRQERQFLPMTFGLPRFAASTPSQS